MNLGWIKVYRELREHPRYGDSHWVHVWLHLLILATHKEMRMIFEGQEITLKPGQFITSRKSISAETRVEESKVERLLKVLESEHQIEQRKSNANRLITITNWDAYQKVEQRNEQPVNNGCTTDEQPVNTNKNEKKEKNGKEDTSSRFTRPTIEEVRLLGAKAGLPEVECDKFFYFYESKDWMIGKNRMKQIGSSLAGWRTRWMEQQRPKLFTTPQETESNLINDLKFESDPMKRQEIQNRIQEVRNAR